MRRGRHCSGWGADGRRSFPRRPRGLRPASTEARRSADWLAYACSERYMRVPAGHRCAFRAPDIAPRAAHCSETMIRLLERIFCPGRARERQHIEAVRRARATFDAKLRSYSTAVDLITQ